MTASIPAFDNSYARLPAAFHAAATPDASPSPALIRVNHGLAKTLGLDAEWLESDAGLAMLSGRSLPETAAPIAMAYGGHQFGGWSHRLGDGRAILIGEVVAGGERFDLHLKGAGRTEFSRGGDGKATLGSVIREYIVSEAMTALGVPSSRALAAVRTGETVVREQPEPGAILTRVARSHVRVGTFQYFFAREDQDSVRTLADYVIDRHYPSARDADNAYEALFEQVARRQASLIAHWMSLGFIHGVMNTDNVQIAGETIDYGPCAFMDDFSAGKVFSSIDRHGRYAWANQPGIGQWNLTRFAETLLPLVNDEQEAAIAWAERAIAAYREAVIAEIDRRFAAKLGMGRVEASDDRSNGVSDFISETLEAMENGKVDFTLFFRHLTRVADGQDEAALVSLFDDPAQAEAWLGRWRTVAAEPDLAAMQAHNPIFIPRNHRVEEAIAAARDGDDAPFHRLVDVLARPFDEQPAHAELEDAPMQNEIVHRTFCGT